jgi:hypothetical protein
MSLRSRSDFLGDIHFPGLSYTVSLFCVCKHKLCTFVSHFAHSASTVCSLDIMYSFSFKTTKVPFFLFSSYRYIYNQFFRLKCSHSAHYVLTAATKDQQAISFSLRLFFGLTVLWDQKV